MTFTHFRRHLIFFFLFACDAGSFASPPTPTQLTEKQDRAVDQVALQSLDRAAKKLRGLIAKYHHSSQEPVFLERLAEVNREASQIAFRLAHAQRSQEREIKTYHSLIEAQIQALNELIQGYPEYPKLDRAWFLRAKAYGELNQTAESRLNYLKVVQDYKGSSDLIPSYLALSEIATQNQNHREAISYLLPIESQPQSIYYPISLYRLGWAHYNLSHIPQALAYLEKQILYFNALRDRLSGVDFSASDAAIRETSLMDTVAFYYDACERKLEPYSFDAALSYFRRLEDGPLLGKLALRFGKLLRAHRQDRALIEWKNRLIKEEKQLPETLDVIALVLDHQLNQNQWEELKETMADLSSVYRLEPKNLTRAQTESPLHPALLEAAKELQKQLQHSVSASNKSKILDTLIQMDSLLIEVTPVDDPHLDQIHFNLAEAYFEGHQYKLASQNYRWILSHGRNPAQLSSHTVELSWIRSRFEELRKLELIPLDLSTQALESGPTLQNRSQRETLLKKLPTLALEWVNQIDRTCAEIPSTDESINQMIFEKNRLIYAKSSRSLAVEGLVQFAVQHPESQYAPPSVALAVDTLIQSSDWIRTHELAEKLAKVKWPKQELNERLRILELDSAYEVIEAMGNRKEDAHALIEASLYIKNYPQSHRISQVRYLMAQSQLRLQDKRGAINSLELIISAHQQAKKGQPDIFGLAILQRASLLEESFQFKEAANDYQNYLGLHPNEEPILKKLPILHWLVNDPHFDCHENLSPELLENCQKFQSLAILNAPVNADSLFSLELLRVYQNHAFHGPAANRALWAAVVLSHHAGLKLHELLRLIKTLVQGWKKLEPASQITLLPALNSILPNSLASVRSRLIEEVPLRKTSAQGLIRRSEWIREFESVVSGSLELPWARLRAIALQTLSGVYRDLVRSIENSPIPKEMIEHEKREYSDEIREITIPFNKKAIELSQNAYQIASKLSIEADDWLLIKKENSKSYLMDTEALQKALPKKIMDGPPEQIHENLVLLDDPSFFSDPIKKLWMTAFQKKQWAMGTFLLQELQNRKIINENEEKILQALTWNASGAQAEAIALLETILPQLKPGSGAQLRLILFSHYASTRSIEKSAQLWGELNPLRRHP